MARERNQALQIPDGGGAKQRPAERVAQQVNRSKPRGQGRRPAMAVGLRAARENGGGAGDKAETQREARLHEKSGPVRPRPGCLAQVAVLPEASAAYLSGRDGDLGGRANSVDSDRQSNVGGRTMGASASRLPDARPGRPICSAHNKQPCSPDSWQWPAPGGQSGLPLVAGHDSLAGGLARLGGEVELRLGQTTLP